VHRTECPECTARFSKAAAAAEGEAAPTKLIWAKLSAPPADVGEDEQPEPPAKRSKPSEDPHLECEMLTAVKSVDARVFYQVEWYEHRKTVKLRVSWEPAWKLEPALIAVFHERTVRSCVLAHPPSAPYCALTCQRLKRVGAASPV